MMDRMESLEGNLIALRQAIEVLTRLDDQTYACGDGTPGISPVGVHFRHILDHYRAFLVGLAEGEIDYDARERQVPLETDRELAIATVRGFITDLSRLPAGRADRSVRVTLRSVAGEETAPDWSQSSLHRELQFLVSHSVHHYALIKELLRHSGVDCGDAFGIAPSTIVAQRQAEACAR